MLKLVKSENAATDLDPSALRRRLSRASPNLTIYVKGEHASYRGPGGWGVLIDGNGKTVKLYGGHPGTSENQMAIMAAIAALESLSRPSQLELWTDSEYVKNGASWWIVNWKANGWKTKTGDLVRHRNLWKRLDRAQRGHKITWSLVTADNSTKLYRRAAFLARKGLALALRECREVGPIADKPGKRNS